MSEDSKTANSRRGFSDDAVATARKALRRGGGGMAQFSHPELGGHGQWMPGMLMLGDMFNTQLKARVDALFAELLEETGTDDPQLEAEREKSLRGQSASTSLRYGMEPMTADTWYSKDLGTPSSTGGQNDVRYAYFPQTHRLAIDLRGTVTIYETGDHRISGVSQGQSNAAGSMTFTSQHGVIPIDTLKIVG